MATNEESSAGRIDAMLLAYDQALSQGQVPSAIAAPPIDSDQDQIEFRGLQRCLRILEKAWPRASSESFQRHLQAVDLAARLQEISRDLSDAIPMATLEELRRAVCSSGMLSETDIGALLDNSMPDETPRSVEQLVYELVQRNLLSFSQAMALCTSDLRKLVLAEFVILEQLGRGGLGAVYKALDRKRNIHVALKTLHRSDAEAILRLKREFRSLANLVHPNLVALDGLRSVEGRWFFTMELVNGRHFSDYVRDRPAPYDDHRPSLSTSSSARLEAAADTGAEAEPLNRPQQLERLRASLAQLTRGLTALHDAGKLHRDIKPSNVLVTEEGRVVLVDFGLVIDLDTDRCHSKGKPRVAGTVAYMSPEQCEGRPLSAASDWYSVGVMLFQTLTGRRPFEGDFRRQLKSEQRGTLNDRRGEVPKDAADLVELCHNLLRPDPEDRYLGRDILRAIAPESPLESGLPTTRTPESRRTFVGRETELKQLGSAFRDVQAGQTVSVHVRGHSGIGKTALLDCFLRRLTTRQEVCVLRGRCHEQESVPYKALDGVVDALAEHLRQLPQRRAECLVPSRTGSLLRVFPSLQRVKIMASRADEEILPKEDHRVRLQAIDSLRRLLAALAREMPVVLAMDDLQWGDRDSASILADLLLASNSPPLLFVGCYRSDDVETGLFLQTLFDAPSQDVPGSVRTLALEPMGAEEVRELALALWRRESEHPLPEHLLSAMISESQGNPYFALELMRELRREEPQGDKTPNRSELDLDAVLLRRTDQLPAEAGRLLEMIAVAGHPIKLNDVFLALETKPDTRTFGLLRSERLIRTTGGASDNRVEPYHDRIREGLVRRIAPLHRKECHRRLAVSLQAAPDADPEMLCTHFRAAGDAAKAGRYGLLAADKAAGATAFDHAATLYQIALDSGCLEPGERPHVLRRQADALASAGRCQEAATIYSAGAELLQGTGALELRFLAADQLLRIGHFEHGKKILAEVLVAQGMPLPKSPRRAIWRILADRLRLRLRGMRFRERPEELIPREDLLRIDTASAAATRLASIDGLTGMSYATRSMLGSLASGEPGRVATALAVEALICVMITGRRTARYDELMEKAKTLGERQEKPEVLAHLRLFEGEAHSFLGNWRRSAELVDEAEATMRRHCSGMHWDIAGANRNQITALFFLGEIKGLSKHVREILIEADQRGDLYAGFVPRTYFGNMAWLAADRVEDARRQADNALHRWPKKPLLLQHVFALIGSTSIDLYAGDAAAAWTRLADAWPRLRRSLHMKHRFPRILLLNLRARAALASLGRGANDRRLIRSASRDTKRLLREPSAWSRPLAHLVSAAIAANRANMAEAADLLHRALRGFQKHEMALYAAATQRRLAELVGGTTGQEYLDLANTFFDAQDIRNPARMTAMLAPGFEESP